MLNSTDEVDHIMLAIHAIVAINQTQSSLNRKRVNAEEQRDALVLRAYYLGLQYPGCSLDPFSDSQHPLKDDLTHSFLLGTGAADTSIPKTAVIH
jgi:hypothetical protein